MYSRFDVVEKSLANFKEQFNSNNNVSEFAGNFIMRDLNSSNKLGEITAGGSISDFDLSSFSKFARPDLYQVQKEVPATNLSDLFFNPYEGYVYEKNNVLDIYYLEKGARCSKSVCRINVKDPHNNPIESGTGFIIKGGYLVTNQHVLILNREDTKTDFTKYSNIELNVQYDLNGDPMQATRFELVPGEFLYHSEAFDLSIVKIKSTDTKGSTNLDEFGYLDVTEINTDTEQNKFLSIIQHPAGGYKKVVLRENQKINFDDIKTFIANGKNVDHLFWYATNTTNGSSGSPVFNDKWDLVGVHHSGIPIVNEKGEYECIDGIYRTKQQLIVMSNFRDRIRYKANEGIKTNFLINILKQNNIYNYE